MTPPPNPGDHIEWRLVGSAWRPFVTGHDGDGFVHHDDRLHTTTTPDDPPDDPPITLEEQIAALTERVLQLETMSFLLIE